MGPDAFDCWGLVRYVQRQHYGREMPHIAVYSSTAENLENLHAIIRHSLWKRASDEALDGDVLLMQGADGPHVGIALEINGIIGVLHAIGSQEKPLSVVFTQRLEDLAVLGFAKIQKWRFTE